MLPENEHVKGLRQAASIVVKKIAVTIRLYLAALVVAIISESILNTSYILEDLAGHEVWWLYDDVMKRKRCPLY